jgi:tripartite ATP-independent transporter DctM subunit
MITSWRIAKKRGYPVEHENPPTLKEVGKAGIDAIWAILFPIILLVGIRMGFFTASEAGAFAVVYAFIIGAFVYRELSLKSFWQVVKTTLGDNGVILFIIMTAATLGFGIIVDRVPQNLAGFITTLSTNPQLIMIVVCVMVFVFGMFMEGTVNTLLLTPIFLPLVENLGVNPVHFGIVFMTTVTLGGMTPPVGTAMYASCAILQTPIDEYTREALPFFAVIFLEILLLIFVPDIFMWLPRLVYGG